MKKIILGILTSFLATSHIPTLHAMELEPQSHATTYLLNRCIQFCCDHKGITTAGVLTFYVWTKYITTPWREVTIPREVIPSRIAHQKELYLFGHKITLTSG